MNEIKEALVDSLVSKGSAHENIDNEILTSTIQRTRHAAYGNWMEGLYEAETRGGDKRFIHRAQPRYPNKEAWQDMDINLRRQIKENPQFADTLSQEELPRKIRGMEQMEGPGIIKRLLSKLMGR